MRKNLLATGMGILCMLVLGAGCTSLGTKTAGTTGPAGMFISADKGETWKSTSILPRPEGSKSLSSVSVYKVFNNTEDPDTLYWASRGNGLFYTYDQAKTWQLAPAPLNTGFIYSVAVNTKDKCVIYASNGTSLYHSSDCNRSWKEIYRDQNNDRIVAISTDPFSPARMYMLKTRGDLMVSDDTGISWKILKRFSVPVLSFNVDPFKEGVLYVSSEKKGLYRSDDAGKNWVSTDKELKKFTGGLEFRRFVFNPAKEGEIYWISTYGVLVSEDRGAHWKAFSILNPPGTIKIYGFAINPKNVNEIYYVGTTENRSVLYKTIDGGENWITKRLPSDQIPTTLNIHPENDNILLIGFTIPPKD